MFWHRASDENPVRAVVGAFSADVADAPPADFGGAVKASEAKVLDLLDRARRPRTVWPAFGPCAELALPLPAALDVWPRLNRELRQAGLPRAMAGGASVVVLDPGMRLPLGLVPDAAGAALVGALRPGLADETYARKSPPGSGGSPPAARRRRGSALSHRRGARSSGWFEPSTPPCCRRGGHGNAASIRTGCATRGGSPRIEQNNRPARREGTGSNSIHAVHSKDDESRYDACSRGCCTGVSMNHGYSGGKRQREADRDRKKKEKQEQLRRNRAMRPQGVGAEVVAAQEVLPEVKLEDIVIGVPPRPNAAAWADQALRRWLSWDRPDGLRAAFARFGAIIEATVIPDRRQDARAGSGS